MIGPIPDLSRFVRALLLISVLWGVALTLSLMTDQVARAEHEVNISGTVRNGSDGAEIPVGLEVLLHQFGDVGQIDVVRALVEEDGSYTFPAVAPQDANTYAVTTNYLGVLYSTPVELPLGSQSVELLVYEVAESIDVIRLEADVMAIVKGTDHKSLSVLEVVSVVNDSDRTFLPDLDQPANFNFMRFSYPEGATNLDVEPGLPGGQIINIGTGFALTAAVAPGIHQVTYTYNVSYSGSTAALTRSFPMGVDSFRLLLQGDLGKVEPGQLVGLPPVDVGGTLYATWEAADLNPGDRVTFVVAGLPTPSWWERTKDNLDDAVILKIGIPSALAAVLIGLLLFALISPRWRVRTPVAVGASLLSGQVDVIEVDAPGRERLVQEIADLDDLHERGEIGEDEYRSLRETAKKQLLKVALAEGSDQQDMTEEELERGDSGNPGRQQEQDTET